MKIIAFAARPDEAEAFKEFTALLDLTVDTTSDYLGPETVHKAKGYDGVSFLGSCNVNREVLLSLKEMGIQYAASRSMGYNNVDLESAKELDIHVSNAPYSPNCVADFAVMLILMSVRKMKSMMRRNAIHDYSLVGVQGKEMHNLTFGIIGTGRIGATVARNLSGFGGRILAYDVYQNHDLDSVLKYVDFETLLTECDVITLHIPTLDSTYKMINQKTLKLMKPGVVIVNCARSDLIDTSALIDSIESGHIGAVALDVFPNEVGIIHKDNRLNILNNHMLSILESHHNVIVTPHAAFYTDQAVSDMVEVALQSLKSFKDTGTSRWEVR